MHVCICLCIAYALTHAYVQTCKHTHMRTCTHTCMLLHAYSAQIHVCMYICTSQQHVVAPGCSASWFNPTRRRQRPQTLPGSRQSNCRRTQLICAGLIRESSASQSRADHFGHNPGFFCLVRVARPLCFKTGSGLERGQDLQRPNSKNEPETGAPIKSS